MVAGFDRYYQMRTACATRTCAPDRGPEFTQVDIEMSFVPKTTSWPRSRTWSPQVSGSVVPTAAA